MQRTKGYGQASSRMKTGKSWTTVVKESTNSLNTEDVSDSTCYENMLVSAPPQMEWPTYQENGQRKYGPPSWWNGPPPPKGTEVYLSRLHRQVLEDELCPILSTVGTIYTFRLMMDFSGSNRGYGFVQYTTREEALKAIEQLNDYPIRPGTKMSVEESLDNCRLFIGHIPKELTESKLTAILNKYLTGLKQIFLYMSPPKGNENRGFCFVEFEDHRSAAMGRRFLLCSGIPEWRSINVTVDWAVPETEVPENVMEKVTTIYIRNLLITTTEEQIRQLLKSITVNVSFITKVKKLKDFAFVHFVNRKVAEYAIRNLDGTVLDGTRISVSWAKPPPYRSNGEYGYGESCVESSTDSDDGSRRNSFGSTQSTDDCYSSPLKGAPLLKRKGKSNCNKHGSEPASRCRYSSVESYSSSDFSSKGGNIDDSFTTDKPVTPGTAGQPHLNAPAVVSTTAAYCALVQSLLPSIHGEYSFQDHPQVNAFDLNNNFNLLPFIHFEKISTPIFTVDDCLFLTRPEVLSNVPDTETFEYHSMKEIVSKLLVKHSDCAYEVLRIIAEDFEWGEIWHQSLEVKDGWIVGIRVKQEDITKNLVILENPCKTENDALNQAAAKFLHPIWGLVGLGSSTLLSFLRCEKEEFTSEITDRCVII